MPVRDVGVVVVGAGHNGLAMSAQLSRRGIQHVVLERGAIGQSWRSQRWNSFTLLTPNWQTRLPGASYEGDDPDGFMSAPELVAFLEAYAGSVDAPVETDVTVLSVQAAGVGYEVVTDQGAWHCACVVVASGFNTWPAIPTLADSVPSKIEQVNPLQYKTPNELPAGGVLVVGAGATGLQLAEEIQGSGRSVTLSVGEHVRLPRLYRGKDIQFWMELIGRLDERHEEVDEILKARKGASPQLIGTPERRSLGLNELVESGVQIRGRLGAIRNGVAMFSGGLRNHCALADQKMQRLLDEIDAWIDEKGVKDAGPPERFAPTTIPKGTPLTLDLNEGKIESIVWATGLRPDHSWLDLEIFDENEQVIHYGGVAEYPGLYFLGANFLRRRRSSFIHGAESDTDEIADHLANYLRQSARANSS